MSKMDDHMDQNEKLQLRNIATEIETIKKIKKIAKEHSVRWCLFGGFAANLYGSDRILTDIDILVDTSTYDWLKYSSLGADLILNTKSAHVGNVEICKSPVYLGGKTSGYIWNFDQDAFSKVKIFNVNDTALPVMSVEDIIVMKAILGRGEDVGKYDLFDIKNIICTQLKKEIDFLYIARRAQKCGAKVRVLETLASVGGLQA